MAAIKKIIKKPLVKSKPSSKKVATKKVTAKKKITTKKITAKATKKVKKTTAKVSKVKPLTRLEQLNLLYPYTLSKEEKLEKVLQFAECKIYDLVREKVAEAFSTYDYEFDSFIEWLDSHEGKEFLDTSDLFAASIVSDVLFRAVSQYEVDSWNEHHATLTKTARYVFDESHSLFDYDWYEPYS
jgi:hypothetical protein